MSLVQKKHPLKELNSFGVDVYSALYAAPSTLTELNEVLESCTTEQKQVLIMGEGSNILFTGDFDGLVLKPCLKGIELLEENTSGVLEESPSEVLVKVGAGENWDSWVEYATDKGWFGLENLSHIPGSVGSAPVQNIGAYGVELKDSFEWLEALDRDKKEMVRLRYSDCKFGYRSSIFKHEARDRYIITSVCFRLSLTPSLKLNYGHLDKALKEAGGSSPADLRQVVIDIRKQKLPDHEEIGNAGSFFKNPVVDSTFFNCMRVEYRDIPHYPEPGNKVKIPAAWLIEQSGWKGKRNGNVGTWPTQPLVIVNHGGATGNEIYDFSQQIVDSVNQKFGITLEREVNVV